MQLLVDAAARLVRARPDWARDIRIVCHLSVPDLFGSELCLYMDGELLRRQLAPADNSTETKTRLVGESLARRWRLVLPHGFNEVGLRVFRPDKEEGDYRSDWWFFGDVE